MVKTADSRARDAIEHATHEIASRRIQDQIGNGERISNGVSALTICGNKVVNLSQKLMRDATRLTARQTSSFLFGLGQALPHGGGLGTNVFGGIQDFVNLGRLEMIVHGVQTRFFADETQNGSLLGNLASVFQCQKRQGTPGCGALDAFPVLELHSVVRKGNGSDCQCQPRDSK